MKKVILFSLLFAVCGVIAAPIRGLVSGREIGAIEEGSGLPYGAVRVEYIESTGTQYIDTGVIGDKILNITLVMQPIYPVTESYCRYFGAHNDNNNYWNGYLIRNDYTRDYLGLAMAGASRLYSYSANRINTISFSSAGCYCNEYAVFTSGWSTSKFSAYSIYLFVANNQNKTPSTTTNMRCYRLTIEDHIDLIPVRFKNENGEREGAMLDLVSGELFRNLGTGSFIIGPDL